MNASIAVRKLRVGGNRVIVLMVGAALLLGCNHTEPAQPASPPQPVVNNPPPPPPPQPIPSEPMPSSPPVVEAPPPPPPAPPQKPPETIQTKADVGSGNKGRGYGMGVVATPVASLFAAKEMIAFRIQIPEAMKLFKATEDRAPKSHEEFMERIIKENHIPLPTLPEGHRYRYDPKTEQLMVEQPAP